MSKTPYILYRPYKDLSTIERLLMSWIISLNDAKQVVCFSNEYAAKLLKQSTRNISRSISSLKQKGFINTFQPLGDKRFIHLLKEPEIEDISFQSCDLEGVEKSSTPHRQDVYTPIDILTIPIDNMTIPIDKLTTNNKEYNKDYTKEGSMVVEPYPPDFLNLVELYQEEGVNTERAFRSWNSLDTLQRKMAVDNVGKYFLYLDKSKKNKKELHFYLSDGAFAWASVKNFRETKKGLTDKEKQELFRKQINLEK